MTGDGHGEGLLEKGKAWAEPDVLLQLIAAQIKGVSSQAAAPLTLGMAGLAEDHSFHPKDPDRLAVCEIAFASFATQRQ